MANMRVSLISHGKVMLKRDSPILCSHKKRNGSAPSLMGKTKKCGVFSTGIPTIGFQISNSTLLCKLSCSQRDFASPPEGLCWEKHFSAVSPWLDIFIEQLEQTVVCFLFPTVPKVLVLLFLLLSLFLSFCLSVSHTHTHTLTHQSAFSF